MNFNCSNIPSFSLASGQYGTYETLSSWAYLFVAGLGNVEHTITVRNPLPGSRIILTMPV
jgi:hypothetical protein